MPQVTDSEAAPFLSQDLARAISNPRRARILAELNKRVMSPSEYAAEFNIPVTSAGKAFRRLEELGCAEIVEERSGKGRRGGVEHFYRATQRAVFDTKTWERLPLSIRNGFSGVIFATYMERVVQAMEAGTLDANDSRHFTWVGLLLDLESWSEMIEKLDDLYNWVAELRVQAALRLARSGETPIPATIALAGFESPRGSS